MESSRNETQTFAPNSDAETAFHLWVLTCGDNARVARMIGVTRADVGRMCVAGSWDSRCRVLADAPREGTIDDASFEAAQRALNRGVNYVQGHRLRELCDRAMRELMQESSVLDALSPPSDLPGKVTRRDLKGLADLAKAMETAQRMTSNALGDADAAGIPKRGRPRRASASVSVSAAMDAAARSPALPSAQLLDGSASDAGA